MKIFRFPPRVRRDSERKNGLEAGRAASYGVRMKIPVALLPFFSAAALCAAGTPEKPNIVLFLVDDMGWQDTSVPFYGNEKSELNKRYKTPNMERLAAKGVKFVRAYACPVSSPTRVSLITGANAAQHKVTNWTSNVRSDVSTDARHRTLDFEQWNINGMSPSGSKEKIKNVFPATPLPELLRKGGYHTIHVGKAHFGTPKTLASDPRNLGFDVNIAGSAIGGPETYLVNKKQALADGGYNYGVGGNRVLGLSAYNKDGCCLTEALTRAALAEIDAAVASDKPFFLYMSQYAVHAPYSADRAFDDRFETDYPALKGQAKTYATMIAGMDKSLGDILDRLERDPELEKNTVVIFMSDNGGHHSNGNAPGRGGKGSCFEGGIHEPMIAYWPGVTRAGTVCDAPVVIEDFFPTILEIAGADAGKTAQRIDGESFVPALRGEKADANRPLFFHYPNFWGENNGRIGAPQSAILMGKWKLVHFYDDGKTMLFDLSKDIGETRDLSEKEPGEARKLARTLTKFLKKNDATRPVVRATGKPCPWPDGSK